MFLAPLGFVAANYARFLLILALHFFVFFVFFTPLGFSAYRPFGSLFFGFSAFRLFGFSTLRLSALRLFGFSAFHISPFSFLTSTHDGGGASADC